MQELHFRLQRLQAFGKVEKAVVLSHFQAKYHERELPEQVQPLSQIECRDRRMSTTGQIPRDEWL
jgi:hypothetical protein